MLSKQSKAQQLFNTWNQKKIGKFSVWRTFIFLIILTFEKYIFTISIDISKWYQELIKSLFQAWILSWTCFRQMAESLACWGSRRTYWQVPLQCQRCSTLQTFSLLVVDKTDCTHKLNFWINNFISSDSTINSLFLANRTKLNKFTVRPF